MVRHRSSIRIGISGWRYAPWRGGAFYPQGLPQRSELAFAARQVHSIELNGSFYGLQTPASYHAWHDATPDDFVFAIKGPRYLTHLRRLRDADQPLANFFASGVLALGAKLGPMLWQLPPQLAFDPARVEAFLVALPRDTASALDLAKRHDAKLDGRVHLQIDRNRPLRHAIEVRHDSFRDPHFIELLRKYATALVVADTAGRWPLLEDVTASFMYLRLHGDAELYASGYSDAALESWAARIRAWADGCQPADARLAVAGSAPRPAKRDVYVYFDNDIKVHAPHDAIHLAEKLGVAQPLQAAALLYSLGRKPSIDK